MTTLVAGANKAIASSSYSLDVSLPSGATIDVTALALRENGKVAGDGDMCFFNQKSIHGGSIQLGSSSPSNARFEFALSGIPSGVEKVVITAAIDGHQTFGSLGNISIRGSDGTVILTETSGRTEKAMILAELYRRAGEWKVRNVSQGFNGGLKALAEHFGVEVEDTPAPPQTRPTPIPASSAPRPAPTPAPAPAPTPAAPASRPVSLTKISLTKENKSVSLKKNDGKYGKIRVNLNWNQKKRASGIFGLGRTGVDLDIGAMVEDTNGNISVIQALGQSFGKYDYFPYIHLLGDDRTGAVSDGEWLDINGNQWHDIHRIVIYAMIYEGVPNWAETDATIRVLIPNQPEVEVRMNEFGSSDGCCVIAYLENKNNDISVTRELKFFKSQRFIDEHYGFGFTWTAGRK